MCDNLNLDINNYTINELLNFFDCNLSNSIDTIKTNYEKKISSLINLPNNDMKNSLNKFFKEAYDNIISTKERNNKIASWYFFYTFHLSSLFPSLFFCLCNIRFWLRTHIN